MSGKGTTTGWSRMPNDGQSQQYQPLRACTKRVGFASTLISVVSATVKEFIRPVQRPAPVLQGMRGHGDSEPVGCSVGAYRVRTGASCGSFSQCRSVTLVAQVLQTGCFLRRCHLPQPERQCGAQVLCIDLAKHDVGCAPNISIAALANLHRFRFARRCLTFDVLMLAELPGQRSR